MRTTGRFDRELAIPIPNEDAREEILRIVTKKMRVEKEINYKRIARLSPGYVPADIVALAK